VSSTLFPRQSSKCQESVIELHTERVIYVSSTFFCTVSSMCCACVSKFFGVHDFSASGTCREDVVQLRFFCKAPWPPGHCVGHEMAILGVTVGLGTLVMPYSCRAVKYPGPLDPESLQGARHRCKRVVKMSFAVIQLSIFLRHPTFSEGPSLDPLLT
jgi:hypothetical protein